MSAKVECGYCGKMIDPPLACSRGHAAPPQADAGALLREWLDAQLEYDAATGFDPDEASMDVERRHDRYIAATERLNAALDAARAYIATKDAP